MSKVEVRAKRIGTIAHYTGVACEYLVVIFLAAWLNNALKFRRLFGFLFKAFGLVLSAFGLFLIVWCCWLQFKVGRGTTGFSEPTQKLITSGPYGVVRNPMMSGQFLFFAGLGFLLDLAAMFLILPILILATHGVTIWVEEPSLERRFGPEWANYAERVPRWVPRLGRARDNKSADSKNEAEEWKL